MIPKVIHYCWFGGREMPTHVLKCIESWKKYCPEYQIIQWNEKNYDIRKSSYTSRAHKLKKWAFVSDYARLDILYNNGGFYLDTDVELLKSLNNLANNTIYMGLETNDSINSGLGMGSEKGHIILKDLLQIYDKMGVEDELNLVPCVTITTQYLENKGFVPKNKLQKVGDVLVYPTDFFCPKTFGSNKVRLTENTYSIHHYDFSWDDSTGIRKVLNIKLIPLKKILKKLIIFIGGRELLEQLRDKRRKRN